MKEKKQFGCIIIPDFKTHGRAIVIEKYGTALITDLQHNATKERAGK